MHNFCEIKKYICYPCYYTNPCSRSPLFYIYMRKKLLLFEKHSQNLLCEVIVNTVVILRLIENSTAHLILQFGKSEHIIPVLYYLSWLPVKLRVDYKLLFFICNALNAPPYVCELVIKYKPRAQLRLWDMMPKSFHVFQSSLSLCLSLLLSYCFSLSIYVYIYTCMYIYI